MKFFGEYPGQFWKVPAYWMLFLIALGAATMAWHDYPVPFIVVK